MGDKEARNQGDPRFVPEVVLGDRAVGPGRPCYIIAEAGVNHFGSLDKAKRLVDAAVAAGCDALKIQVFDTNSLVSSVAPEWRERLRPKELSWDDVMAVRDHCLGQGITFCATAHDQTSLDALAQLEPPFYKIGSGEIGNWDFIQRIGGLGRPVVLSTGMYTQADVGRALEALSAGGCRQVVLLHCVTRYPARPEELNLRAIETLSRTHRVPVGYSDHTEGYHLCLAAAALGAVVLEKHISLDFNVPDAQDWKVSLDPAGLKEMVAQIRQIEAALGDGVKKPAPAEAESLAWARKSLVAAFDLPAGTMLDLDMLAARRPGTGIPPSDMDRLLGRRLKHPVAADTPLKWEDLES